MFTGIITDIGRIAASENGGRRINVQCRYDAASLKIGESIGCNGTCLTVVEISPVKEGATFTVELSDETLKRTVPGAWAQDKRINLERAMKMGDALDGHLVTGHVDAVATIREIIPAGDSKIFVIETPEPLSRFIAEKGSVTLDGISLTVNEVQGHQFRVNIIPHTLKVTTLGERKAGDALNLEVDLIARYVARLVGK